jgi:hypothetical protein
MPDPWRFDIPDYIPQSLNALLPKHWAVRARIKRKDAELITGYFLASGIPRATKRRQVTMRITLGRRRKIHDDDNLWKYILDALVSCGAIVDDKPKWLSKKPVEYDRAPRSMTTIFLEDLPDEAIL